MKRWEDIIKDKLEGYEANLPEGSLSDFRRRLDESRMPVRKRPKLSIGYVVAAAVAVCLALVFIINGLWKGDSIDENPLLAETIDGIKKNEEFDVSNEETIYDSSTEPKRNLASVDVRIMTSMGGTKSSVNNSETAKAVAEDQIDNNEIGEPTFSAGTAEENVENEDKSSLSDNNIKENTRLLAVDDQNKQSFLKKNKVGIAAGSVLGTGLVGGLASTTGQIMSSEGDYAAPPIFADPGEGNNHFQDNPAGDPEHSFPLRVGLSVRRALSDKFSLTSGLEYSMYSSTYEYSLSGEKKQHAHYLGIPVRIDYSFARSKWLDVYIGAGGMIDYCLSAQLDGKEIKKDGFSFSLVGAGGVQLNVSKCVGVFMEPQIVWSIPSSNRTLETYRTEHPVSFNISTGLRVTIGNK